MTEWKTINVNINNIDMDTGRAVLIKMPHNSVYDGFKFWHPSKLIRKGLNKGAVTLSYTDEFTFNLFKNGNGKYNKFKKIAEKQVTVEEFEQAFSTMSENIRAKESDSYLYVEEPDEIQGEVVVPNELKNE